MALNPHGGQSPMHLLLITNVSAVGEKEQNVRWPCITLKIQTKMGQTDRQTDRQTDPRRVHYIYSQCQMFHLCSDVISIKRRSDSAELLSE